MKILMYSFNLKKKKKKKCRPILVCDSLHSIKISSYKEEMRPRIKPISPFLSVAICLFFNLSAVNSESGDPTPAIWPHQFHAVLFMNSSGTLQKVDLWYDWPNGRNFNIIQNQLGKLLYDLEWDNGTSYIYTLDSDRECRVLHFPVGILRPNWLDGANYLGQAHVDGFLCNVWEKVDFIWYYEDVATKRPVHWVFYTGYTAHVMTFEVGAVLDDADWQAPSYCFKEAEVAGESMRPDFQSMVGAGDPMGRLMGERSCD